jgi:hypothetical protein
MGGNEPASLLRLESMTEGPCVQVMHHGPYDKEDATIAGMHKFVRDKGLSLTGRHHEIYLNNPNTTAPEDLRTILRQPVK